MACGVSAEDTDATVEARLEKQLAEIVNTATPVPPTPLSTAAPVSTSQQAVGTTTSTAIRAPASSTAASANAADDEEHAAEDASSGEGQVGEHDAGQLGGGNIFTTGTPEQQTCLRNALGDTVFEAIASGARTPTETDNRAMNPCIDGGPDNGGNETAS